MTNEQRTINSNNSCNSEFISDRNDINNNHISRISQNKSKTILVTIKDLINISNNLKELKEDIKLGVTYETLKITESLEEIHKKINLIIKNE